MGVLDGKTALVAGGGTGIGKAIASRFYAEGATVFLCGRREEMLLSAARSFSPTMERVFCVKADITEEGDVGRLMQVLTEKHGRLDILVNSAGTMKFGRLEQIERQAVLEMLTINTVGPWMLMKAALPLMRKAGKGSIINLSSLSGIRPSVGGGAYCTSKAALIMLSQVFALEIAEEGIRINLLCPGLVEDTELGSETFSPEQVRASYERFRHLHPLGRNGKPEDVAEAALFFASDASSWITGAVVPVDGGRHMTINRPA